MNQVEKIKLKVRFMNNVRNFGISTLLQQVDFPINFILVNWWEMSKKLKKISMEGWQHKKDMNQQQKLKLYNRSKQNKKWWKIAKNLNNLWKDQLQEESLYRFLKKNQRVRKKGKIPILMKLTVRCWMKIWDLHNRERRYKFIRTLLNLKRFQTGLSDVCTNIIRSIAFFDYC